MTQLETFETQPVNIVADLLAALSGNGDFVLVERDGELHVEPQVAN